MSKNMLLKLCVYGLSLATILVVGIGMQYSSNVNDVKQPLLAAPELVNSPLETIYPTSLFFPLSHSSTLPANLIQSVKQADSDMNSTTPVLNVANEVQLELKSQSEQAESAIGLQSEFAESIGQEEEQEAKELETAAEMTHDTYVVTAYYLNVRHESNANSKIVNTVKQGTELDIIAVADNGWLQLKDGGYVNGKYTKQSVSSSESLHTDVEILSVSSTDPDEQEPARLEQEDQHEASQPSEPTSVVKSKSGLTQEHIAKIFKGTALAGHDLEEAILDIEEEYGINAYFTIAVMKLESGHGKSKLAKTKNNLFGLNAIDGKHDKAFSFKTKSDSVHKFGQLLSKSYVGKGLTTIEKVGKKYCPTNSKWPGLVKSIMKSDYKKL